MELLSRLARWFASGIAFALGVLVVMAAWQYIKDASHESVLVSSPADLKVLQIEPLTINTSAGVIATLSNSSTRVAYSPASFELRILHEGKLLSSCSPSGSRPQLNPASTATTRLTCSDVLRSAVPAGAVYQLSIEDAWRFKQERTAATPSKSASNAQ